MSNGKINSLKALAREFFHNAIADRIKTSAAPSEQFIDSCFDANLSIGETLKAWANRFS
jgi:hypothetical protein